MKCSDSLTKHTAAPKKAEPVPNTAVLCRRADHAITHRDLLQLCSPQARRTAPEEAPTAHLLRPLNLLHPTV